MAWWARIGKLLQFLGALSVVIDLIDADRLRGWGKGLRRNPFRGKVKAWAVDSALMQIVAFVLAIVLVVWAESVFSAQFGWMDRDLLGLPGRIPDWMGWLLIGFFAGLGVFVVYAGNSRVRTKACRARRRLARRSCASAGDGLCG